jgi:hypothetical protein
MRFSPSGFPDSFVKRDSHYESVVSSYLTLPFSMLGCYLRVAGRGHDEQQQQQQWAGSVLGFSRLSVSVVCVCDSLGIIKPHNSRLPSASCPYYPAG